jgi:peptidoglycan/LPS O-acetylase OafA/YrhL
MTSQINTVSRFAVGKATEGIYFPELDGLRFFAFILVFIHHHSLFSFIPYLSILHTHGWIGVDLFFVLSAFLFTKLLVTEYERTQRISFKKFYLRRVFRIWPIYFLFVGFSMVCYLFQNERAVASVIGGRLIGLLSFSDNIFSAFDGYNPMPYVAHLWTIGYEEQFYVFIPIVIFLLVRASVKGRLISLVSVFILFNVVRFALIANEVPHPAIWVLPITHFESILMGIVIGFGGMDSLLKRTTPSVLGFIGIAFFAVLCRLPNVDTNSHRLILSYSFIGMSTSLVMFSVFNSGFLKSLFSAKMFVFLGKRSYGLYVYHLFGIAAAEHVIEHTLRIPSPHLASFLFALSFTILISIISYRVIEAPFLKLKKRFEVVLSRPI